ncbi:MAG: NUDIX hydrolase [Anaerolineales bacterium]|nr:NUDIX hydrolase [Anaerolineales bacterium]
MKNKDTYLDLVKKSPALFDNKKALLEIILDTHQIESWEKNTKRRLEANGLPESWADIGIVFSDAYFYILRDLVKFPDQGLRGYTRVLPHEGRESAVAVLPRYKGMFLLLRQYRHPTRSWHYEIPRGFGEPNLSPEENAIKELSEEINGKVIRLNDLGILHTNSGFESTPVNLFLADMSATGDANLNEGIDSVEPVSIGQLEKQIALGKITDSFTIAAYTRAKLAKFI